jgi:hypothetical protein
LSISAATPKILEAAMKIPKFFDRSSEVTLQQEKQLEVQRRIALRAGQITGSACRRGLYEHDNCSPYQPCHDLCPVVTPPSEGEEKRNS